MKYKDYIDTMNQEEQARMESHLKTLLEAERKAFIRETSAKLLAVDFQSEYTKKHFNETHYKAAVTIASELWEELQEAGC